VKENPAQGGGRGPVISGELQVPTEWRDEVSVYISQSVHVEYIDVQLVVFSIIRTKDEVIIT